jgi:hypothetical protein
MKAKTVDEWAAWRPGRGPVRRIEGDLLYVAVRAENAKYEVEETHRIPLTKLTGPNWRTDLARRLRLFHRDVWRAL